MARIRTIKPEFPQDEKVGQLSIGAAYFWILTWTLADDSGRLRGNSRLLASLLYPFRAAEPGFPEQVEGWLGELERLGMVRRYLASGEIFMEIINWLKHQKIDKPSPSKIPPFDESSRILSNPREQSATDRDLGSRIVDLGVGSPEDGLRPLSEPHGSDASKALSLDCQGVQGGAVPPAAPPPAQPAEAPAALELEIEDETEDPADEALVARRRRAVPFAEILAAWAEICPDLPQTAIPTEARRTRLRRFYERAERDAAAKDKPPMDWIRGFFGIVAESDFLTGRRGRGRGHENFVCDLWWCIQPEKYAFILEGRYDNRRTVG